MRILLFFVLLTANQCISQVFNFEHSDEFAIVKASNTLQFPFVGGINYGQFSEIDIDFDGDMDLFVFDRMNENILVFRNVLDNGNRKYEFVPNGRFLFPEGLRYRAQLADYNNDGKNDIFTYGIGGMKVFKNIGNSTVGLKWELAKDLLYSQYPNSYNNLYVSSADMPALVDVEGDGDLDILTFNISGLHLEYHKNMSQELYGHSDSLVYQLKNECWGKFSEDPNNSSIVLNDPNSPCNGGSVPNPEFKESQAKLHSGSNVLALDLNNDGVKDLILGDISSPTLAKLINGGTSPNTNSAMVSVEYNYPSNSTSVDLNGFPAPFYIDVDFDGKKDLIVCSSAKNVSENVNSVWFYKNTGTNSQPIFNFQTKSFLQNQMIDHGTGSIPMLFDQNNDGKEDLIVANFFRYKDVLDKESNISVYRNTSTTTTSFTFIDDNFLNLIQENLGLRTVPTFGDLTGNGKKDMLLARETGQIAFYRNTSTTGNATFAAPLQAITDNNGNVINEGTFPTPQLFDLDNDGLLDLIIGKKSGELVYYKNTGTAANYQFTRVNTFLGGVDVSTSSPDGYATPHFFRQNDTTFLFLGALNGQLYYFKDIDGNLNPGDNFVLHSSDFLDIDVKGYSSFFVSDIDNDGYMNLLIGTDLGGLKHLEVDPNSNANLKQVKTIDFEIFPNPNAGEFSLVVDVNQDFDLFIYNVLGKKIDFAQNRQGEKVAISVRNQKGVFLVELIDARGSKTVRRVIIR